MNLEESLTLYEVNTHVLQQRKGPKMPVTWEVLLYRTGNWHDGEKSVKCPLEGTPHALPCTVSVLGV